MRLLLISILSIMTMMAGCSVSADYKTEGTVKGVSCDIAFTYITMENGVKYKSNDTGYCRMSEGIKVAIYHDSGLRVNKIVIEGAEEVMK